MGFLGSTCSDAVGSFGGLFLGWSSRVVVSIIFVDENVIFCKITSELNLDYYIVFVYGCPYLNGRAQVWSNIKTLMAGNPGSTTIVGNLNQVEHTAQKLGGSPLLRGAQDFINWKLECDLSEIPARGMSYTWTNNRSGESAIFESLDRAYACSKWRITFPDAIIWKLPIFLSD
ncbi:uncharacterized protein [Spinacia oleracea]|uniref:Endonuclease/exonuclease/phosphatase domain-containing protein n=1 Tax=Spinacia oleracea TaxID=3562 RepID=A0ABM3RJB9_SPIOL|nr:uncharacterized protein LOC130470127 [Spinacia oleracea]